MPVFHKRENFCGLTLIFNRNQTNFIMNFLQSMRKIILFAVFGICVSNLVCGQNASSKIDILIKEGKVTINKKAVSKDWQLEAFKKCINEEPRETNGSKNIYTYDALGIVVFEKKAEAEGEVSEFQIYTDEAGGGKVAPQDFYEGKLRVEKLVINSKTTIEDIRTNLNEYTERETESDDSYRFAKAGVYIYFQFNTRNELVKTSIGKDKLTAK